MQTQTHKYELHFILECLDALTEARQRSAMPGPVFSLADLIHACQTQGPVLSSSYPAKALSRELVQLGWVAHDPQLGFPTLTQLGIEKLKRFRVR